MCSPAVLDRAYREIEDGRARFGRRSFLAALGASAAGLGVSAAGLGAATAAAAPARAGGDTAAVRADTVIDLTHTLTPQFPVWPGNEQFAMRPVATFDTGRFAVNAMSLWEHTGTHLDAPAHIVRGGATVEALPVRDFVAPLAVVDIAGKAAQDDDAVVTVDDVAAWERQHGPIPPGALVAMHSGWETRLADPASFVNADALRIPHAPGFDRDAVRMLVHERNVVGLGVDTLSLDRAGDVGAHVELLGAGRYGIEAMANLATVPPRGATVVVGAPKHAGGTGGPCRVLALV
ncbi:cyclase family protein [Rhodococcus sp. CSLK01-03]|uniref:Cyclase family protein n=1 Tax=Rhodococcus indonesiensis TaxID=3055869 RepID=A0ABT7RIY9_9NOCA|nr:cyclase family protein [Rhodococcus indonesiensis]MDM7487609.1 cyclase family protein [Rhodococcus indonesiensis]